MSPRNEFSEPVKSFNLESVLLRMQTDFAGFVQNLEVFSNRSLTITDANLGIDRKLLYTWKKQGLLPFYEEPVENTDKKNWGRFSFIEVAWLKTMVELRMVGVGIEKLKEIKQFFFRESFLEEFFSIKVADVESMAPQIIEEADAKGLLENGFIKLTPEVKKLLNQLQLSLFSVLLYSTIMSRNNYLLIINGKGDTDVLDLNQLLSDPINGMMEVHQLLSNETVAFVNIRKIIAELSDSNEYFSQNLKLGERMSEASLSIFRQFFAENKVKEVKIRISEKGRPMVWVTKNKDLVSLENEVRRLTKKGKYYDVQIKTRDGKVQYFESTELIKL